MVVVVDERPPSIQRASNLASQPENSNCSTLARFKAASLEFLEFADRSSAHRSYNWTKEAARVSRQQCIWPVISNETVGKRILPGGAFASVNSRPCINYLVIRHIPATSPVIYATYFHQLVAGDGGRFERWPVGIFKNRSIISKRRKERKELEKILYFPKLFYKELQVKWIFQPHYFFYSKFNVKILMILNRFKQFI